MRPPITANYGKRHTSPLKTRTPLPPPDQPLYVLSSSPISESAPVRPTSNKRKVVATSSDHGEEEKAEESRGNKSRSSKVDIVLPSREKEPPRNHSPDPLDSLPKRSTTKSNETIPMVATPSSSNAPTSTHQVGSSVPPVSQRSGDGGSVGTSRRVSSRVQEKAAKAETEKVERRKKRALEKAEKARKEGEKTAGPSKPALEAGVGRESRSARRGEEVSRVSPMKDAETRRVRTGQGAEVSPGEEGRKETSGSTILQEVANEAKKQVSTVEGIAISPKKAEKSRKRKADDDDEESEADDLESWDEEDLPIKAASKTKPKNGKAKPVTKSQKKKHVTQILETAVVTEEADVSEADEGKEVIRSEAVINPVSPASSDVLDKAHAIVRRHQSRRSRLPHRLTSPRLDGLPSKPRLAISSPQLLIAPHLDRAINRVGSSGRRVRSTLAFFSLHIAEWFL